LLPPPVSQLLEIKAEDSAELIAVKQYASRELAWALLKIQSLEERLRKQRIAKYGPSAEKLSNEQLELLELEPGVSLEEVDAEAMRDQDSVVRHAAQAAKRHPGRQELPASLPRVEKIVKLDEGQCQCGRCGKCLDVIGYETSEQLEVEPAKYFVLVTKREKRACGSCGESGVKTAAAGQRIIDKGLVSDRVVINTVIAKYCDHLPLYRQSAVLARETGVEIHRATMDGWVMRAGELLLPVAAAMRRELVSGTYLQADETPVEVQMHDGKGKNHQAYLWQYSRPGLHGRGGTALFDFQMGRSREGPKKMLREFSGILQSDGYAAYDKVGAKGIVHAACWAHARRKFVDALKLNPKEADAARIVARMNAVFAVDALARQAGHGFQERHAARLAQSRPLLDALREDLVKLSKSSLPSSELGKGVNYTLHLWKRLTCFLDHPELELSNNRAENSMRGIALGRKNWIHVGSAEAGPKVAAILSVVETCKRLGLPVRDYLLAVLPGLGNKKLSQVASLTPEAWMQSRPRP
jgi:transposase